MEGIIYQYDNIKTINLNEYDLIVKSINSDYDSFANLMKLHKRHLYQMAYIHTRDKDMALDIIQETTIVAFKNIKLHNPNSPLLIGEVNDNDIIKDGKQESFLTARQITIF